MEFASYLQGQILTISENYDKVIYEMFLNNLYNFYKNKNPIIKRMMELLVLLPVLLLYRCPFKLIFHINCPGCGMTRAVFACLRLDFKSAFQYHSLFPVVILGAVYYVFREKLDIGKKKEELILTAVIVLYLIRWVACLIK